MVEVAEDLCLLGRTYFAQKRYQECEQVYQRALSISESQILK